MKETRPWWHSQRRATGHVWRDEQPAPAPVTSWVDEELLAAKAAQLAESGAALERARLRLAE